MTECEGRYTIYIYDKKLTLAQQQQEVHLIATDFINVYETLLDVDPS